MLNFDLDWRSIRQSTRLGLPFWPLHLASLSLTGNRLIQDSIALLPKTLTSLRLSSDLEADVDVIVDATDFPPSLTYLHLWANVMIEISDPSRSLPPTLRKFHFVGRTFTRVSFERLPSSITELLVGQLQVETANNAPLNPQRPDLDYLSHHMYRPISPYFIAPRLPPRLTRVSAFAWNFSSFASLPRSLTDICFHRLTNFIPSSTSTDYFNTLPTGLREVSIQSL